MTARVTLTCAWCGTTRPSAGPSVRCHACHGPLTVDVDLAPLGRPASLTSLRHMDLPGLWSWVDLLPVSNRAALVSLGEGDTPLLTAARMGRTFGLDTLLLKDETRNPTGSFKDRMLAVGVSDAVDRGATTVAVQSSGNVGAAAAAYAARAGLSAKIFVPRTAPAEKVLQAQMYGAEVFRIDHDSPADIFDLLAWACAEFGWHLVSTAAIYNPYTLEGAKTIAYEIAEQLQGDLPDWVIVPVGGGGNVGSVWRGFLDLRELGLVDRLPRMVGVQAAGCAPIVDAVQSGRSARDALATRWPSIDTVAGAIADDVLFDAHIALPAIRDSGGLALAVTDADALAMEAALARAEGLFVEPAAATTLAAVRTLMTEGCVNARERVLCLLTGHGLKDPAAARSLVQLPGLVPLDRAAIASTIRRSESG